MTDAAINAVRRRDRAIVLSAIVAITALAWAYVLWLAATMDMGMEASLAAAQRPSRSLFFMQNSILPSFAQMIARECDAV